MGKLAVALVKLLAIYPANLCSLPNKMEELLLLNQTKKALAHSPALCSTETWLGDSVPSNELLLSGFHLT